MKKNCLTILLSIVLIMVSFICRSATSDWPERIERTLWVPSEAYKVMRNASQGVYSVSYKLDLCQPADSFLAGMVKQMKALGWSRLEFDPYNPGLKLNHAKQPGGLWDRYHHRPDGYNILQWIDDWEDSKKNVVRYCLRYRAINNDFRNACTLEVIVSYFPANMMQGLRIDK